MHTSYTFHLPAQRQVHSANVRPLQLGIKHDVESGVCKHLQLFQRAGGRNTAKWLDLQGVEAQGDS